MKIVTLEEHFTTPAVVEAWARADTAAEDHTAGFSEGEIGRKLPDLGDQRLRDMDHLGVDVQVLSLTSPGVQNIPAEAGAARLARDANDVLAAAVRRRPDRFQAFATMPTTDPDAAADELHRAITQLGMQGVLLNGRSGDVHLDDPSLDPMWAAAAQLRAPVYIHPQVPTVPVREAYYTGFGADFDRVFSTWGIGWHYETGVELLRLIYSGTFDRYPELQVIVGHWGELVLFFEERIALLDTQGRNLRRPLVDYLRTNVYYTNSGISSERSLRWAVEVVGIDRIMYATDYPYLQADPYHAAKKRHGYRRWIEETVQLDNRDREKIAHGTWDGLTAHLG